MIKVALTNLRFHKGGFIASFIALFLGATIVMGCGTLLETGIHAAAPPQRLAAAPIVVTGDQRYPDSEKELVFPERIRLDTALAADIAAVPGVAGAVADVSFSGALARDRARTAEAAGGAAPAVHVTGHGWSSARLAPIHLSAGEPPSTREQIVIGARLAERTGLRPGDRIELLVHGGLGRYAVSGVATGPGDDTTILLSDAEAARVTDRLTGRAGRLDSIGVLLTPGADTGRVAKDIRTLVRHRPIVVLTGDERGRAEDPGVIADAGDLIPLAAAFGGLSAMVTVFVVAGTLGLSIRQRQREMALLRAIGATPGRVRRMILGETTVLAVAATALAWYPGPHLGRWLLGAFADAGVVPDTIAFRAGSVPLIVGAGTALIAALAAAFVAASTAARTRPTEALAEASLQRRPFSRVRLVLGLVCLAGGLLLARGTAGSDGPDAAGVATPAVMVWAAGFGLLGPPLSRAITAALRRPLGAVSGLAGELAAHNTRARAARVAAAVMPIMLATGLALSLIYMHSTESEGARRDFDANVRADLVVTSDAGGFPVELVDRVAKRPGVAAATAQITSVGYIQATGSGPVTAPAVTGGSGGNGNEGAGGGEAKAGQAKAGQPTEVPLHGVTPEGLDRTTAFRAVSGDLAALRGDTVALPERYTDGRAIGDPVPLRLGDGTHVVLTLVATLDARPGYETALVPASLLLAHTDAGLVPRILVSSAPGADRAELAASIAALAQEHPGLRTAGREALEEARAEQDETQTTMAYLLLGVVVGYATISLVNTQILATAERRREFALLRLVGATRRQVLRMTAAEALLVAGAGTVLGVLVAALTLVPVGLSVLDSLLPGGSPWTLVTVVAAASALTLASGLLATAAALRTRPGTVMAATARE